MQTHNYQPLMKALLAMGVQSDHAECFSANAAKRAYEAKENLFVEGDSLPIIGYVCSGYVRLYVTDQDGEISTRYIAGPGQLIGCISATLYDTPAEYTAECVSDCELLIVNKNVILEARRHAVTRVVLQDIILKLLVSMMQEKAIMLPMKATDRYLLFRERYPGLMERIPAGIVANYIGVRPQSLSRIKQMLK